MFPSVPNAHALAVLLLMVLTLYLFTREKYPLEITSLALLALLAVGFSVFPYEHVEPTSFFYGLGHEALVAVCALMVIGQGMVVTGALEPVGRILARVRSVAPFLSFAATLISSARYSRRSSTTRPS